MESDAQLVSSEFPIGVRLGSDQETYLTTESLSPCSSSEIQQWPNEMVAVPSFLNVFTTFATVF